MSQGHVLDGAVAKTKAQADTMWRIREGVAEACGRRGASRRGGRGQEGEGCVQKGGEGGGKACGRRVSRRGGRGCKADGSEVHPEGGVQAEVGGIRAVGHG